jgi:uncharacterized phage-associated protein
MTSPTFRDGVCDYVIHRLCAAGSHLNFLKLQKLMYYVQAWYLAFYGKPLFPGKFQAWVHGPVNRELYDRFKPTKSLYSEVSSTDVFPGFDPSLLPDEVRNHVHSVLDVYAQYTGSQLEEMTHREEPWLKARIGCRPAERCEREIDESLMASYYRSRLPKE